MKEYERPPRSDWTATFWAIVIVVVLFALFTALTEEPENQAIEDAGETIYQLKS